MALDSIIQSRVPNPKPNFFKPGIQEQVDDSVHEKAEGAQFTVVRYAKSSFVKLYPRRRPSISRKLSEFHKEYSLEYPYISAHYSIHPERAEGYLMSMDTHDLAKGANRL